MLCLDLQAVVQHTMSNHDLRMDLRGLFADSTSFAAGSHLLSHFVSDVCSVDQPLLLLESQHDICMLSCIDAKKDLVQKAEGEGSLAKRQAIPTACAELEEDDTSAATAKKRKIQLYACQNQAQHA